tara:strand:- start:1997 stop:2983 length:987 start_codon:yes stop_codon:yes gene_type:complete
MKRNQTIKYDSIMVDYNGVKTKGRIHVSNESLSFERKIGLISKKFEPMLKIPIESITSVNKKTYFEISLNYVISDQKVIINIILNTPAEVIEIIEKINSLKMDIENKDEKNQQLEQDNKINQIDYSTYIYDTSFKILSIISIIFELLKENTNSNWDNLDNEYKKFNELIASLENNNINLVQDSTKIKSALQTRDTEKIFNAIKSSIRTLGNILESEIPYKEWNEYDNSIKPSWNNIQIFYLLTMSLNQAIYFSKLNIDFDKDKTLNNIFKYIPIVNSNFSNIASYNKDEISNKMIKEDPEILKEIITQMSINLQKNVKELLKQASLLS